MIVAFCSLGLHFIEKKSVYYFGLMAKCEKLGLIKNNN
jgi:hypothetical protein